ncbi:MAG: peptide MFS transporter [Melioribacteraceae bacterium]|nr:MAG: peptide MFS transporter [Melioribacteraceae bacterium]
MTVNETAVSQESWKFPREFWLANVMELCERAAYYGFFIVLTLYLTDIVGFTDKETGVVAGVFFALLYFLPPFVGAISDKIGFKNGLMLAFTLLTIGYFFLGVFHTKILVILFLTVVLVGASFIKPLITGTVAKTSNEANKARAFSLFYWVVNIGAFSGKTFVPYIRQGVGVEYVNFFSAGMSLLALILAALIFKPLDREEDGKTVKDVVTALKKIFTAPRLIILTVIVSGFWIIQHQLYATMPKYVIRLLGEQARPEWLANVNPAVVVIFVVLITQWTKKWKAVSAIFAGMVIMPFSALAMAMSSPLQAITGTEVSMFGLFTMHPLTLMMIIGIGIQGLAECFISPRFLEYFAKQAPKGEEGTYMGFSHLHSFLSALFGFILSGFLLDAYCPDPNTLPAGITEAQKAAYYVDAHLIWYYFVAIASVAAVALFIFRYVTNRIDEKAEAVS